MDFPITKIENVEGAVRSVNGLKGNVVVDLPVGFMHISFEKEVPVGRLPAFGATYNRTLYADLWQYANDRGLVISESEWQAQASANGGNCAYYSDGDGSTTFRVPSLKCWVKGANGIEEVGSYLQAGLPNIEGSANHTFYYEPEDTYLKGAFGLSSVNGYRKSSGTSWVNDRPFLIFDASRSNPIYGNSDTVQPKSIVGMWLIVAYGTVSNIGNADVSNVMQAVESVQANKVDVSDVLTLEEIQASTDLSNKLPNAEAVKTISFTEGTTVIGDITWHWKKYADGTIEQWADITASGGWASWGSGYIWRPSDYTNEKYNFPFKLSKVLIYDYGTLAKSVDASFLQLNYSVSDRTQKAMLDIGRFSSATSATPTTFTFNFYVKGII